MVVNERVSRGEAVKCAAGVVEIGKSRYRQQGAEGCGFYFAKMRVSCSRI
jgi:hypothetical protein